MRRVGIIFCILFLSTLFSVTVSAEVCGGDFCVDHDGTFPSNYIQGDDLSYFTSSFVTITPRIGSAPSHVVKDYCLDETMVMEQRCENPPESIFCQDRLREAPPNSFSCPHGCVEDSEGRGYCRNEEQATWCEDSDSAGDVSVKGILNYWPAEEADPLYDDVCVGNSVRQYFCGPYSPETAYFDTPCGVNGCTSGVCRAASFGNTVGSESSNSIPISGVGTFAEEGYFPSLPGPASACVDTQMGFMPSTNGVITVSSGPTDNSPDMFLDVCYFNSSVLQEYACVGTSPGFYSVDCPVTGCGSGVCSFYTDSTFGCFDPDYSSVDMFVPSETVMRTADEIHKRDYCYNGTLHEYSCLDVQGRHTSFRSLNMKSSSVLDHQSVPCNKCENGACVPCYEEVTSYIDPASGQEYDYQTAYYQDALGVEEGLPTCFDGMRLIPKKCSASFDYNLGDLRAYDQPLIQTVLPGTSSLHTCANEYWQCDHSPGTSIGACNMNSLVFCPLGCAGSNSLGSCRRFALDLENYIPCENRCEIGSHECRAPWRGVNSSEVPGAPEEDVDTDGDGVPNSLDPDDDNDGFLDGDEISNSSDPLDPTSTPETQDDDGDGLPNSLDPDDDGDGILDEDEGCGLQDLDADGVYDLCDYCPYSDSSLTVDANGCTNEEEPQGNVNTDDLDGCTSLGGVICGFGHTCDTESIETWDADVCCISWNALIPPVCSYSSYSSLTGQFELVTYGACVDPDGDGLGTRMITTGSGYPAVPSVEECTTLPATFVTPFSSVLALLLCLFVLLGFYFCRRNI